MHDNTVDPLGSEESDEEIGGGETLFEGECNVYLSFQQLVNQMFYIIVMKSRHFIYNLT